MQKKLLILTFLITIITIIINAQDYKLKQIIDRVGSYDRLSFCEISIISLSNYYPYAMIHNTVPNDWYRTVVLKYNPFIDSMEYLTNIDSLNICGSGDFDNDGLVELLGHSVAYDGKIAVMEQQDTNQIYTVRTWESPETDINGVSYLGVTNLFKNDGIDRIVKAYPITTDSGFYYYSPTGDNNYYVDFELSEDRKIASLDVGFLDDDSLVDIIGGTDRGQTWWEAKDSDNDSFEMIKSGFPGGVGTEWTILGDDIDEDGKNEFIIGGLLYLMDPCEWEFNIVEYDHDTIFNEILEERIQKDYGNAMNFYSGNDIDLADVDGDGKREIIWCAGSILRIYDVIGNDSFQKVWEIDNDTFSGSHVRCYDFNENGRAEIIWEGSSDPDLPHTSFDIEYMTYIFEYYPDYYTNTLDSAKGTDGRIVQSGIDKDDMVTLYFSQITDMPLIDKSNIDSIFRLSGGHSWLDGSGNIKGASWSGEGGNRLIVQLSDSVSLPTVSIGDSVYLDTLYLNGIRVKRPFKGEVIITGTFGPAGINTPKEDTELNLSFHGFTMGNSILEYTTYTKDTHIEVYDITGRTVFTNRISNIGLNTVDMKPLASGIYFIRIKTPKESISKSIIRM